MTTARLVVMLGTYIAGLRPVGVLRDGPRTVQITSAPTGAAITIDGRLVGTTPATGSLAAKVLNEERIESPLQQWDRRRNPLYLPDVPSVAYTWLHDVYPLPITTIEPDQPQAGDTRITIGTIGAIPRKVGDSVRVRFSHTGLADLDDYDHRIVEVTDRGSSSSGAVLVIRDFVASGTATFGFAAISYLGVYDGESTSHTDATHGGAYPSPTFGPDYRAMALLEDHFGALYPGDPLILVQLASPGEPLRARATAQGGRWLAEFEAAGLADGSGSLPLGAQLSQFAELRDILTDVVQYLDGGFGLTAEDIQVAGLVMCHGLHDAALSDVDGTPRVRTISSADLSGSDLLITTTAAHGVPAHATKAWQIGLVEGLTTDPDGIVGAKWEVERVSDTQLRVRGLVASEAPTFAAGSATIDLRAPCYWFEDDLLTHVDEVRELLASMTATAASSIRTVLMIPDRNNPTAADAHVRTILGRAPARRSNVTLADLRDLDRRNDGRYVYSTTDPLSGSTLTFYQVSGRWRLTRAAGGFSAWRIGWNFQVSFNAAPSALFLGVVARVVSDTEIELTTGSGGIYLLEDGVTVWPYTIVATSGIGTVARMVRGISNLYYSTLGVLDLGEKIAGELLAPSAPAVLTARRPVIVAAMLGHSYGVGRPVLAHYLDADPRVLSDPSDPKPGVFVWNQDTQQIEDVACWVDELTGLVSGNINTHPEYNHAQLVAGGATVGPQVALLHGLRERFPDESVGLLNLSVNGATIAAAASGINPIVIVDAIVQPEYVALRLATSSVSFNRQHVVTISGVTGLSPAIDGTHLDAEPIFLGGLGTTAWIRIPGAFTGTPNVSAATASIRPPVWKPSAGELYAAFEQQAKAFYDALLDAGYFPDARIAFGIGGINDARAGSHADFAEALDELVPAVRGLLQTRARPREFAELPFVWMQPILHDGLSTEHAANLAVIRAALAARASADQNFRVMSLDQSADWLLDYASISIDGLHPTGKGLREIGYRLARLGGDLIAGWSSRHPVDFTPQTPVDVTP